MWFDGQQNKANIMISDLGYFPKNNLMFQYEKLEKSTNPSSSRVLLSQILITRQKKQHFISKRRSFSKTEFAENPGVCIYGV